MRKSKVMTTTLGATADGAVIGSFKNSAGYTEFCIETLAGSVKVVPSLDGVNFVSQQLVLAEEPAVTADTPDAQVGLLVGKTTAGKLAWFFGALMEYQFVQVGATPAQVRVRGSGDID